MAIQAVKPVPRYWASTGPLSALTTLVDTFSELRVHLSISFGHQYNRKVIRARCGYGHCDGDELLDGRCWYLCNDWSVYIAAFPNGWWKTEPAEGDLLWATLFTTSDQPHTVPDLNQGWALHHHRSVSENTRSNN